MVKIKCPFCGEVINTNLKSCPNCGKEFDDIKMEEIDDNNLNSASPKDPSWVKKWKRKPIILRIIFGTLFVLFFVLAIILLSKESKSNSGYGSYGSTVLILFAIASFIFFIDCLTRCRVTTKNIDGYNVVVACGYFHRLIIEDEVVVWRFNVSSRIIFNNHTSELVGYLPNRKRVWADVNDFFGHAIIGVSLTKTINIEVR